MTPQPAPKRPRKFEPESLAVERFGDTEGLMLVHATKMELAEHYAAQEGLDFCCPDVVATCTLKAWTRWREFALIQHSEEAIYTHAERGGLSYSQALYEVTLQGTQKGVLQEISRLHSQAKGLGREIKSLKPKD